MTLNSVIFIFLFLPLLLILNFIVRKPVLQNIILVLFSFIFYSWMNPVSFALLILCIGWDYFTALELKGSKNQKEKKVVFIVSILFHVFILFIYKYLNFVFGFLPTTLPTLSLPVGLSFFTFTCISYLADVYTNKSEPQRNILNLALYISFFGKVTMGPIVQYNKMEDQLAKRNVSMSFVGSGIRLFVIGLIKKAIFADTLSILVSNMALNPSVLGAWLYVIAYTLQIYFDFSGYSDMAIGLSRLFGFDFEPNFDHPYMAVSVQDFWRRWHISLSRWFRDYIYIPLGGSRVGNALYIRNIFVVWLLTGIWHGANWTFIVWGLYFGCFLLLEKFVLKDILVKLPKIIQRIYALVIVVISWAIFMSDSLGSALSTIGCLFGIGSEGFINQDVKFYLKGNLILILLSILFSTPIWSSIESIILYRFKKNGRLLLILIYVLFFFIAIAYVISSTFQSFLYFAF